MGASLVAHVFSGWTHLNDTSFRILARMALTALDKPKAGRPADHYFGGRELLAMALRRPWPPWPGDDAPVEVQKACIKARATIYRDVRAAIAELVKQGAIERIGDDARTGRNQVYRLRLDR